MSAQLIIPVVGALISVTAGKKLLEESDSFLGKALGMVAIGVGVFMGAAAVSQASSAATAVEAAPTMGIGEGAAAGQQSAMLAEQTAGLGAEGVAATNEALGSVAGNELALGEVAGMESTMAATNPASAGGLIDMGATTQAPTQAVIGASAAPGTNALGIAEGTVQQAGGRTFMVQGGKWIEVEQAGSGFWGGQGGMAAAMIGGQALSGWAQADAQKDATEAEERRFARLHAVPNSHGTVQAFTAAPTNYINNRRAIDNNGLIDPIGAA